MPNYVAGFKPVFLRDPLVSFWQGVQTEHCKGGYRAAIFHFE